MNHTPRRSITVVCLANRQTQSLNLYRCQNCASIKIFHSSRVDAISNCENCPSSRFALARSKSDKEWTDIIKANYPPEKSLSSPYIYDRLRYVMKFVLPKTDEKSRLGLVFALFMTVIPLVALAMFAQYGSAVTIDFNDVVGSFLWFFLALLVVAVGVTVAAVLIKEDEPKAVELWKNAVMSLWAFVIALGLWFGWALLLILLFLA